MLEMLRIRNMALIEDLEMELCPGLNVLTGESGAGKSFILRALDFILGAKISSDMVRPGADKAVIEAIFTDQKEEELLLRRELFAGTGRSRCYINDDLSSQVKLSNLREKLLIHTSQHGQQNLLKPGYHARIVDLFWEGGALFREKKELLEKLRSLDAKREKLRERLNTLAEKKDFLDYQKKEIDNVAPQPGEEKELLEKQKQIKERADISENANSILDLLHSGGVMDNMLALHKKLEPLAGVEKKFEPFVEKIQETNDFLRDLEAHLRSVPIDGGVHELEAVESRLWEISSLKRKLNRSMEEIIDLEKEIRENISFLEEGELELKQLGREQEELRESLKETCREITSRRKEACQPLKESMENSLRQLGFPEQTALHFEFFPEEIYTGIEEEKPRIMWIPNPGQSPQPLDKIASGGELSRFLLALVGLRSERDLPTLLFDEVDAGIGGETLNKVGRHIRNLAQTRQVLLITHWPQLARLADRHFRVSKVIHAEETTTTCRRLEDHESREEMARMAGGGEEGRAMAESLSTG